MVSSLGEYDPAVAAVLNNIGTMKENREEFVAALQYHEESLRTKRATLQPNDPAIAASLINMGPIKSHHSDNDVALALMQ